MRIKESKKWIAEKNEKKSKSLNNKFADDDN
jgi:hypothetical protein